MKKENDEDRTLYRAPEGYPEYDIDWFERASIPQSMQFMIDLLPTIRKITKDWPWGKPLSVLDLGTSSGAGANLLASLNKGDFFGVPMVVDAIEIMDNYKLYCERKMENINYIVADIFSIESNKKWDLIICSHVIEHFKNPIPFIDEIKRRANNWAVIYAPYKEKKLLGNGEEGHLISIDDQFIERLAPNFFEIIESPAWKHPHDIESKCVIMVFCK